jgi:hypothetical protein
MGVDYHYEKKYATIVKPFDVVLQSYSTLDAHKPGNPDTLVKYSGLLVQAFHEQNPRVEVRLDATWSRAGHGQRPAACRGRATGKRIVRRETSGNANSCERRPALSYACHTRLCMMAWTGQQESPT